MVRAIGVTARNAARSGDPGEEWGRDQLMSAYSATRHLAVELSAYGPEWQRFIAGLAGEVAAADIEAAGELTARVAGLEERHDAGTVGAAVCDLLACLRGLGSPAADALRRHVHRSLRELADREVDLLAEALG